MKLSLAFGLFLSLFNINHAGAQNLLKKNLIVDLDVTHRLVGTKTKEEIKEKIKGSVVFSEDGEVCDIYIGENEFNCTYNSGTGFLSISLSQVIESVHPELVSDITDETLDYNFGLSYKFQDWENIKIKFKKSNDFKYSGRITLIGKRSFEILD